MRYILFLLILSAGLWGRATVDMERLIYYTRDDGRIKVWVYFQDKGKTGTALKKIGQTLLSERTTFRRNKVGLSESTWFDLSVNESYVKLVREIGVEILHYSRWLNGISVFASQEQINAMAMLTQVSSIEPVLTYYKKKKLESKLLDTSQQFKSSLSDLDYGPSREQIEQINVHLAHNEGYFGQGVRVLVMDTGFYTEHEAFDSISIIAQYDFIDRDTVVIDEEGKDPAGQHNHGTYTFSTLGGYAPGKLIGPAFKAQFLLAKTERVDEEIQQEEDDYVAGLEWGEALGADVVSTSLGYLDWYSFSDMDGNTAVTTKAIDIAVFLGMVCVTAAGNENGKNGWGHIIAPADADSVIAVGAVDKSGNIASFSSRGPSYDGRIKPEVCARGIATTCATPNKLVFTTVSGTSLATPLVGGAAAVILSAHPDWSPMMVREALMMTANQWFAPNNDYGWGIIDVWAAINYDFLYAETSNDPFLPNKFSITKAFPNPFNPSINFQLNVGITGPVTITIYNLLGESIEILWKGNLKVGFHDFQWDATGRASGIYFLRLEGGGESLSRKITYLR